MFEGLAEELASRIKMLRAEVAAGVEEAAETVDQEGENAQNEPRMKLMRIYQRATVLEEAAKSKRAALSKELKKLKTLEESLDEARQPTKKKEQENGGHRSRGQRQPHSLLGVPHKSPSHGSQDSTERS